MTAEEFARASGTALVIAKERLLAAENLGKLCRDDTIKGLRFYPNLILTQDWTRDTFFKSSILDGLKSNSWLAFKSPIIAKIIRSKGKKNIFGEY